MNSRIKFAILAVLALMTGLPFALLAVVSSGDAVPASAQPASDATARWSAAAPGRVEPRSGEYPIGAVTLGRIAEVCVKENDRVAAGEVLVKLDDAEAAARLTAALADAALKKFTRDDQGPTAKLRQRYDAADAVFDALRRQSMARDALDSAREKARGNAGEAGVAKAKSEFLAAEEALPKLQAAAADIRKEAAAPKPNQYETALTAAQSQVAVAQALLDQTRIRAPIAGTVLHVAAKSGGTASPSGSEPLVLIGDLTALRVRVEVDARDITHVRADQKVVVRADAFRGREFTAHVTSVASGLTPGRLSPRGARRPGDVEILEVFVAFDAPPPLPPGMRVDVYFDADDASGAADGDTKK